MHEHFLSEISHAVLQTLLYSDVFDYPLTVDEVHRYLSDRAATYEEVVQTLNGDSRIIRKDNYYALTGRDEIVAIRKQRQTRSKKLMPFALLYGRMVGSFPFVRMVALTGSLAVMNSTKDADLDYMVITHPGRLWTARAFILLFNRLTRLFGHTICPNLIVSEASLEWHQHDLYSARELCQMIPISGAHDYRKLMKANEWIKDFLPNAEMVNPALQEKTGFPSLIQRILEYLLDGQFGDLFERWEMDRKIARFSKQEGFGEETIFNANICQGNFDHHHKRTEEQLERRAKMFSIDPPLPNDAGVVVRA